MRFRTRLLRKRFRSRPVRGNSIRGAESANAAGKDYGKYFRCSNCGFVCDKDRDSLGGPNDKANVTPAAYTLTDQYGDTAYQCQGAAGSTQTICEANGGTWASTRYEASGSGGCPFCHTLNYNGNV